MKSNILYKFGKRERMVALVEKGELYLYPASKYANESLSKGAFDDGELQLKQELPVGVTLEGFSKDGTPKGEMNPISTSPLITGPADNALLNCLSYSYDNILYDDFEADTCLIIEDADRFLNQACSAIRNILPKWTIDAGAVEYRNEAEFFTFHAKNQDIYYNKPDKYKHQKEVRIVCTNSVYDKPFEPITVNIGPLVDYTQFTGIECPDKMISVKEYLTAWATPWPRKN